MSIGKIDLQGVFNIPSVNIASEYGVSVEEELALSQIERGVDDVIDVASDRIHKSAVRNLRSVDICLFFGRPSIESFVFWETSSNLSEIRIGTGRT
ncbi:hypothetical protein PFISCL1PPCAC_26311 [Pristionchus fissidentatus]|uniref:Uncharacterized protein n=1 Tax=Pristionchus fissidentatus TaxID=1538716 RepID=A0AAV5WS61_9BILA|nr:hypothetical protein PFISCL1PPCAC_26311 [Pristionchus fissidentatus]